MSDRFRIVIEGDEATNFSAYSPDLPGVAATGLPERNAKHKCGKRSPPALRGPRDHGEGVPTPASTGAYVES